MTYRKRSISLLFLFFYTSILLAGQNEIDSQKQIFGNANSVEGQIKTWLEIATIYRKFNIDSTKNML